MTSTAVEIELLEQRLRTIDRLTAEAQGRLKAMRPGSDAEGATRALVADLAMDKRDCSTKLQKLRTGLELNGWRLGKRPVRQLDDHARERQAQIDAAVRACEASRQAQAQRFEREGDHHQARLWYRDVQGARAHVFREHGVL